MLDLARYVVDAVLLEGRSYRDVAAAHGVSKSWVAKVLSRFKQGGYEAIEPRSKAPHTLPFKCSVELEDQIVRLRKLLDDDGLDAGAATIHYHLSLVHDHPPSVSTIWRVLKRRGFVTPQPHKRPRSSWVRFEAALPNECWQSDMTHWQLADGSEVEIINYLDDYSRLVLASIVVAVATSPLVLRTFHQAAKAWGFPASLLTDNGAIYTASYRGGRSAMESELLALGIVFKHSSPYHPQTCGKVERFHQTLKKFLGAQDAAATIAELQAQIDRFIAYYNNVRPHRAKGRKTPRSAFDARDKAMPMATKIQVSNETRVRHDRIDEHGSVTIRYRSKLHHVGLGREFKRRRVIVLVDGLEIRVLDAQTRELLRALTLNPTRDYQPTGKPRSKPRSSTMS